MLRVGAGGLLAAAMIVACWPTLHRLRSSFVDSSVSDEMLIARSMRETLPPDTVLHANANYPDFAYYSGMTVNPLPETGNALYAALDRLPAGDVLIAYKAADEGGSPPEPPISYLDSNPRFTRLREFPTVVLYRVNPLPGR